MEEWLRERGKTLRLEITGAPYLVSCDPAVVRHVLLDNADNYVKDLRSVAPFLGLLGDGLLTSDGPPCGGTSGPRSPGPSASTRCATSPV